MIDWSKARSRAGYAYTWGRDLVAAHPGTAFVIIVVGFVLRVIGWLL